MTGTERILAHENARLAAILRAVQRRVDRALEQTTTGAQRGGVTDGERVAELEQLTAELLKALADARRLARRGAAASENGLDAASASEEHERISPPLAEVIEELRRGDRHGQGQ